MTRLLSSVLAALFLAGCGGSFSDEAIRNPPHPPAPQAHSSGWEVFSQLDGNDDGKLDRSEAEGHWADIFRLMDRRGYGELTAADFLALPSPRMAARSQLMEMEDPDRFAAFTRLDRDGDGVVSLNEFLAASDHLFGMLDRNHDGVLSPEELGIVVREEPADAGILRLPPPAAPRLPPTVVSPSVPLQTPERTGPMVPQAREPLPPPPPPPPRLPPG